MISGYQGALQDKNETAAPGSKSIKIAVTGTAASGKSLVSDRFRQLGLKMISLDTLARKAVEPDSAAYPKIVDRFGKGVLESDGRIDRKRLRQQIIADPNAKRDLEALVHPEIKKRMLLELEKSDATQAPFVVIEVPLLFEVGLENEFDVVILVMADRNTQINRLVHRDGISPENAESLLDIQMPDEQKVKRADYVLTNSGTMEEIREAVDRTFEKLVQKYGKKPKSLDNP
jgi:dephospho-CoA kinase